MEIYKDKIALVTGGAQGIGRSVCKLLAEYGAYVVIADINQEGIKETEDQIRETVQATAEELAKIVGRDVPKPATVGTPINQESTDRPVRTAR